VARTLRADSRWKADAPARLAYWQSEDLVAEFLLTSAGGVSTASRRTTVRPPAITGLAVSSVGGWAIGPSGAPSQAWPLALQRLLVLRRWTGHGLLCGDARMMATLLPAGC